MRKIFLSLCLVTIILQTKAQIFNRISCDISIKEISFDKSESLLVGKVYYDVNYRNIIYTIRFPDTRRIVISDNGFSGGDYSNHFKESFSKQMIDFSVFNLVLSGELDYYGLSKSAYTMDNVTKEGDMVISDWSLPEEMGSDFGTMALCQKDRRLHGLVSMDKTGFVLSKQFFQDYVNIEGIDVPTKLIQISYNHSGESQKKITTLRNIILNEKDEQNYINN